MRRCSATKGIIQIPNENTKRSGFSPGILSLFREWSLSIHVSFMVTSEFGVHQVRPVPSCLPKNEDERNLAELDGQFGGLCGCGLNILSASSKPNFDNTWYLVWLQTP